MAKHVTETNAPTEESMQDAVARIEQCYLDLASERGVYMSKCKRIREVMAGDYDDAANKGISKKLLKIKIKERELDRKINGLTDDLESDERSEYEMLSEKLGEFASTPLGEAALAQADGKAQQAGG